MKFALYQMETGKAADRDFLRREYKTKKIHSLYLSPKPPERWIRYYDKYFTFVIVRDPIKRVLSTYTNRVMQHGVLDRVRAQRRLKNMGLSDQPSLSEFIDHFEKYRKASDVIFSHTIPQSEYVGRFFEKIEHKVPIEEMADLTRKLSALTGMDVVVPREQKSVNQVSLQDMTDDNLKKLAAFYKDDYAMLSAYYSPDQLVRG